MNFDIFVAMFLAVILALFLFKFGGYFIKLFVFFSYGIVLVFKYGFKMRNASEYEKEKLEKEFEDKIKSKKDDLFYFSVQ